MSAAIEHRAVDAGDHVVDFYETDADLVGRVGAYLSDAAHAGAVAIVIATEAHRAAFEAHLREAGVDVPAAREHGTLLLLDAAATLTRFMRDGRVDRDAFLGVVGTIVREAAATGRPVRAYGEMVALLWADGDVMAAIDLEAAWNDLATEVPFSLYCAYPSESVAGDEHADALRHVCGLHTAVVREPPAETTWGFAGDHAAPAAARRLVADALRRAGHGGDLLDDAKLIVTELAANAVLHARSPFSVSLSSARSIVRIRVRDGSRALPEMREHSSSSPSGRGLRLVAALAGRWGVDLAHDGKVVWAELGP